MPRTGAERVLLQGLIQMAAGCVHLSRGRRAPGLRLLELARAKLEASASLACGLSLSTICQELRDAPAGLSTAPAAEELIRRFEPRLAKAEDPLREAPSR